jgi:purine-binding chemotaxis protein CheW
VGGCLYAIPIAHVVETMRPLPIEPMPGAPAFVSGVAIVRGVPLPVVHASRLLDRSKQKSTSAEVGRFVTVRAGERNVVLAVDAVVGMHTVAEGTTHALPPLLQDAAAEVVIAMGALDAQLLLVLRTIHLVPA